MVELQYGITADGQLAYINNVPNGLACQCRCPGCGATLIAKNNGETNLPHFAHYYGETCSTAHESALHLLAKDIIQKERSIMLPPYGKVFAGGRQTFTDVELEQRHNDTNLQPDACGTATSYNGKQSKLWIEIRVTHAIGPDKRAAIIRNGISCVEINLARFRDRQTDRQELQQFLIDSTEDREWTNNPILEERQKRIAEQNRSYAQQQNQQTVSKFDLNSLSYQDRRNAIDSLHKEYIAAHQDSCIVKGNNCHICKHHTTRQAIMEEINRRHLPAWLKEVFKYSLTYWKRENVHTALQFNGMYFISLPDYLHPLPTQPASNMGMSVSKHEMRQNEAVISFLRNTVPDIIDLHSMHCEHNMHGFPSLGNSFTVACNEPHIMARHKKRK